MEDKDEYIRAYNERVLALISRDLKSKERERASLAREREREREMAERERPSYYWENF